MSVIEVDSVTKDYGGGKGVFDISFSVEKGEVLGFLGPNGAGKTTTIRQLMGFIRPQQGHVSILEMDCFLRAREIQRLVGYLPGEIAFPDSMTGTKLIHFLAGMKGMKDLGRGPELMQRFQLDAGGKTAKMSKGMKQKVGIVCALMHDPEILLLDEPTSGLDPLMQSVFIDLIREEKTRGKTILMSSHIFEETERTCDRAVILRQGKIVTTKDMESLRQSRKKKWEITFHSASGAAAFGAAHPAAQVRKNVALLTVSGDADAVVKAIAGFGVRDITTHTKSLEELFMGYYGEEDQAK